MGRPTHYSAELPGRCRALIRRLSTPLEGESDDDARFGGPLKTTFLVAMATPMIILPFERLFLPGQGGLGVANDVALDPQLGARMKAEFGPGRRFDATPFFVPEAFAFVSAFPRFPVGGDWSTEALDAMAAPEAIAAAGAADAATILALLRNSLAHGGYTYLDETGRHDARPTHMLGFASFVSQRDRVHFRLLRVSVAAFETFLDRWADWIDAEGLGAELERRGPGYFHAEG